MIYSVAVSSQGFGELWARNHWFEDHIYGKHILFIWTGRYMFLVNHNIESLFLAVLGLYCCVSTFSSRSAWTSCCFSCWRAQALGRMGSVVVAHGLSCPMAYEIFLDQGSNLCPLHWRWILNHGTAREVHRITTFNHCFQPLSLPQSDLPPLVFEEAGLRKTSYFLFTPLPITGRTLCCKVILLPQTFS